MSRTTTVLGSVSASMSLATKLMAGGVLALFVFGLTLTGAPDATAQPAVPAPAPSVPLDDPLDPSPAGIGQPDSPPSSSVVSPADPVRQKLETAKADSADDTDRFEGDISNKVVQVDGENGRVTEAQSALIRAYFTRDISLQALASADPGIALMLRQGGIELVDAGKFAPRDPLTDPTSPVGRANSLSQITSAVDSCQYLTFCRWKSVNAVPSADISLTSMSQAPLAVAATFSSFVFTIAGLVFYVMGVGLILIVSVDILSNAIYLIDFMFGAITTQVLGMDGNPSAALGMMLVIAIALVAIKVFMPGRGTSLNLGLKSLAITFVSIGLFACMAYQSTKNHPSLAGDGAETSGVADLAEFSDPDDKVGSLPAESEYAAPADWASFSPGWMVSSAASLASHVGGVVNEATDKIADSVNSTFSKSGLSSCDLYSAGMRAAFLDTAAAQKMGGQANVLVSFDRLVGTLYFRNFQLAAFGNSQGAENAWCRIAEGQAKVAPADQIMVARVAGLYKEIIGVGSMGVIKESNSTIVNPLHVSPESGIDVIPAAGTYLNADGSWTTPKASTAGEGQTVEDDSLVCTARDTANAAVSVITLGQADVGCDDIEANQTTENQAGSLGTSGANAMNVFGYAFRNQEASREFSSYWAACNWISRGDGVGVLELNPEWKNVKQANSEDNLKIENCTEPLIIDNADKQGFGMSQADGADVAKPVQVWNYTEKSEDDSLWSVVSSFIGVGGSSSAIGKFASATQDDGTNRALDYYMFSTGANNIQGSLFAVVAGAMALMTAKYFTPLVAGALFAQALAVGGLTLLAFLMFLLIFPSDRTRGAMKSILKTISAALLSSSILAAFFGLAFAMVTLFTNLLWNNMPQAMLMQAIISGLGAFLAFKLLNMGLKKAMGDQMEMTSWSSGLTAGMGAAAPAFQYLGFEDVMSVLDKSFWGSSSPSDDEKHPEILSDRNTESTTGGDEDPVSDKHRRHSDLKSLTAAPRDGVLDAAAEGVDRAAAAQGGLDPVNDAAAVGLTIASAAKRRAGSAARGFASDAEHIMTARVRSGIETARSLSHRVTGMDPATAAQLIDNTIPFAPKVDSETLARAGIEVPTVENYDEYIRKLGGVASADARLDPATARKLFDIQSMGAINGQPSAGDRGPDGSVRPNPISSAATSAWVANMNGVISQNQMEAVNAVASSQEASLESLRQWGAANLLISPADLKAAPLSRDPFYSMNDHQARLREIVTDVMSNADSSLASSVEEATQRRTEALADLFASAEANPAPGSISDATWANLADTRTRFIDSINQANANATQIISAWGRAQAEELSAALDSVNQELTRSVGFATQAGGPSPVRASFETVVDRIMRRKDTAND